MEQPYQRKQDFRSAPHIRNLLIILVLSLLRAPALDALVRSPG